MLIVDALVADAGDAGETRFGSLLRRRDVGRRQALDDVEIAGSQVGEAHRGVRDRAEDERVESVVLRCPSSPRTSPARCGRSGRARRTCRGPSRPASARSRPPRAAFGDMIMPARSESCESSVASARESLSATVRSSTTSTLRPRPSSLLRRLSGSVRARSMLAFTAAALIGSPSWNFTPGAQLEGQRLAVVAPLPLRRELRARTSVRA